VNSSGRKVELQARATTEPGVEKPRFAVCFVNDSGYTRAAQQLLRLSQRCGGIRLASATRIRRRELYEFEMLTSRCISATERRLSASAPWYAGSFQKANRGTEASDSAFSRAGLQLDFPALIIHDEFALWYLLERHNIAGRRCG